ncbi:hypothetical protein L226DRAFT_488681 [Lentinus tigrinus ALCF2SS1-7]|uniref:Postreplication repair E3 ubiquitin-protein ligase RAD18 n=1 Tax=Lentinus tigrinus ALCF2SS1-6 TaxID=1328759 RepID=A0A5C2SCU1_9APHY|nr:hypothetical protein L227DRAFT_654183 [Lentinus tigrinus ALCF2SS1-6]RPD73494.1 hypothetical protein L226DRAFT_488681 [Lentinus tigrinus ALCF2SS1-7]
MASMLDRLLASDISDPTDFPDAATAPGLRAFDDAVRCTICREFYDAPVTLTCGHCFCSACIRSALPEQQTCPTCRKPASEVHIRKDVAMETAVQAWKNARPLILRLASEEAARKAQPPQPPHARHDSSHSERTGNKRRRLQSPVIVSEDEVIVVPSSPAPSGSSISDSLPDTVLCPVCQKQVPSQKINAHLDSNCKRFLAEGSTSGSGPAAESSKSKQKQRWNQLFSGGGTGSGAPPRSKDKDKDKDREKGKGKARATPDTDDEPEHLPKVAYDIHPQKRIAEMLAEWDLPTHGDKAALTRRHKKWIVLYNANVDRAPVHRRTLDQLRGDLRKAEDAEQKTRKETVDDPVAYQKANKAAFAKLTEAARPKKAVPATAIPAVQTQAEDHGGQTTDSAKTGASLVTAEDVIDVDSEGS